VKPAAWLLRQSGVAVWRAGGGHGKRSEALDRVEAGQVEMGVGSEEVDHLPNSKKICNFQKC
jgi:hypothetical protein